MFVWNIADGSTLTEALLKMVQVNQVRSNIKSPFCDIQNESDFNYASPEMSE